MAGKWRGSGAQGAFWVQNHHLGEIEVENRQEARPRSSERAQKPAFAGRTAAGTPLLTTACAQLGAYGVDGDRSPSEPPRSGAAATLARPQTGPADGPAGGLAGGLAATPAAPTPA